MELPGATGGALNFASSEARRISRLGAAVFRGSASVAALLAAGGCVV